ILLAFLTSDDPLSRWFQGYVPESGASIHALLRTRGIEQAVLDSIAAERISDADLEEDHVPTSSAKALLDAANEIRQRTERQRPDVPLDVRHLMAAYIYQPAGHE